MEYKKPKLIGKDEDGVYKGIIEQIEASREYDILDICNRRRNLWVLSIISGYRQLGQYKVAKPHHFEEGDLVIVEKKGDTIVDVKKDEITISNVNKIYVD